MSRRVTKMSAFGGAVALTGMSLMLAVPAAGAAGRPAAVRAQAPAGSVTFSQAVFHGYSTGSEAHVGAVNVGTTQLASVEQGFSGASTATAGLTSPITSETGFAVQPAQAASVHAYGSGSGLEVGLVAPTTAQTDTNQVLLAGRATQIAPPNNPAVTKQIGPINLNPIANAAALTGRGSAIWDATTCPIGQPISYGDGDAANVNLLTLTPNAPTVNTAGTGTATANSQSATYLSPNPDGTFGLTSQASEIVAPLTVNILNLFTLKVTVAGANPSAPITLAATAPGGSSGASVTLQNAGLLTVTLQAAGGAPITIESVQLSSLGPGGLHIPLSTSSLGTSLSSLANALTAVLNGSPLTTPVGSLLTSLGVSKALGTVGTTVSAVTAQLANISLGSLDIDAVPHAIGQSVTTPAVTIGGTQASGAIDLVHLNLAVAANLLGTTLPALNVANLYLGHMEASANLASEITCNIPVIKSSNPTSVTAGNNFVYTILIPDPAKLPLLACNLINLSATDTISDLTGSPTFQVLSVSNGGKVTQTSPNKATVSWTGLSYTTAPLGSPPNPPVMLTITVAVPASSPTGVLQDTVNATGTTAGCNGGGSGLTIDNGATLTGSFRLQQPSVTAAAAAPAAATPVAAAAAAPQAGSLPHTGGTGGLWQPFAGVVILGLGGGALALARRRRLLG
ncbi:MAG: LPXTG cell wall anchor domain-containing protein [Acidimicrobiales bacterium]